MILKQNSLKQRQSSTTKKDTTQFQNVNKTQEKIKPIELKNSLAKPYSNEQIQLNKLKKDENCAKSQENIPNLGRNENITTKIQEKINVTIQKIRKKNLSIKEDNLQKYTIKYGVQSLAGKNKDNQINTNQDSFFAEQLQSNYNLFCVFDGHGDDGDYVSKACKDFLPAYFKNYQISKKNVNLSFQQAFIKTQKIIELRKDIKSDLSGSTAITIFIDDNKIYCANVGDSRAIIIKKNQIKQLSNDHTPYVKSEYARILQNNGRVKKTKNYYDQESGPLRVWIQAEDTPGLAMTRSMGDTVGKTCGITAEPEIIEENISSDMIIILASDGIWDKLEDYQVQDIVQKFYNKQDPQKAAEQLALTAQKNWQNSENYCDDITCIVCFIY